MKPTRAIVLLVAAACARTGLDADDSTDGAADVASEPTPDASPFPPVDASPIPEASAPDVNVACTSGDYYVAVNGDAGTQVLEAGCSPLSAPAGGDIVVCGHLVDCVGVVACEGPAFIQIGTTFGQPTAPPGSFQANVHYGPTGVNKQQDYGGTIDFASVVDGSLAGTFSAGPLSGTFCVQWQGK